MDKQELQMAKKLNAGFRVLDDISKGILRTYMLIGPISKRRWAATIWLGPALAKQKVRME